MDLSSNHSVSWPLGEPILISSGYLAKLFQNFLSGPPYWALTVLPKHPTILAASSNDDFVHIINEIGNSTIGDDEILFSVYDSQHFHWDVTAQHFRNSFTRMRSQFEPELKELMAEEASKDTINIWWQHVVVKERRHGS